MQAALAKSFVMTPADGEHINYREKMSSSEFENLVFIILYKINIFLIYFDIFNS